MTRPVGTAAIVAAAVVQVAMVAGRPAASPKVLIAWAFLAAMYAVMSYGWQWVANQRGQRADALQQYVDALLQASKTQDSPPWSGGVEW